MPILYDQHVHSNFSGDSKALMEDEIKSAIQKGLKGITFTEHNDINFPYIPGEEGMFDLNKDSYLYEIIRMRQKYEGQIQIGYGVELGMQQDSVRENAVYVKNNDFDFVIFSCHVVNKSDPYYKQFWEGREEEAALREYFNCILENVKLFHNFDVLGHLDYAVRYAPETDKNYSYDKYKDIIDKILETLLENENGLEVNTAGIRKYYLRDVHPYNDILKKYKQLGGEKITVGSDSHTAGYEAADFDRAAEALKLAGFDYYCTFENRIATYHKI